MTSTFRFRVDCPGDCGRELTTAPIQLEDSGDGLELPIDAVEKTHAYCPQDQLFVSILQPDIKADLVEVDE